jgi:dihydroorotase
MRIIIKEGFLVDPVNNFKGNVDILIEEGKIERIDKKIEENVDIVIQAKDKIVLPGLIDLHVHLRQPGREDKETVFTGTKASAKGGITTILAMPNTEPPVDSLETLRLLKEIIKRDAQVEVLPTATITLKREGKQLVDFKHLKEEGVFVFTDDGSSVEDEDLMYQAMLTAKKENVLLFLHCEDKKLSGKGVVNLGVISTRLGLRGIPKEAEYKRIERDLRLARDTGCRIHITHVSCKESIELIGEAKKRGIRITCDTCPHYFSLTEDDLLDFDTNKKINPPLRTKEDVLAIKEALKEGIIDCITSDHAPYREHEKEIEFENAEFGTIGLETELSVAISELIEPKIINWQKLVELFCVNPSKILGIDRGSVSPKKEADLIILDPKEEWVVKKEDFLSRSKNSAFLGKTLKGKVEYTIYKGKIVYEKKK